ncbi:hypothetical protein GW7_05181 [Heterocephalus glaber]|uniref:Uncharacterized protein n=1 Tax=Heterocephalus glaber TaxID=10181 RepID=G5BDD1_HETGA|nr:hypothetical protein GW7_05181 [Heterocephalus glaber]
MGSLSGPGCLAWLLPCRADALSAGLSLPAQEEPAEQEPLAGSGSPVEGQEHLQPVPCRSPPQTVGVGRKRKGVTGTQAPAEQAKCTHFSGLCGRLDRSRVGPWPASTFAVLGMLCSSGASWMPGVKGARVPSNSLGEAVTQGVCGASGPRPTAWQEASDAQVTSSEGPRPPLRWGVQQLHRCTAVNSRLWIHMAFCGVEGMLC